MTRLRMQGFISSQEGDLTPASVSELLDNATGDIIVDLHSTGGVVYEGIEIFNRISQYTGKKTVVLGGIVASIATYVATAFDVIQAQSSTAFMIHNVGSMVFGDSEAMAKEAKELERLNRHIAERLAARSGKPVAEVLSMMDAETWLYGREIVDAGFADELIEVGTAPIARADAQARVADARATHERRVGAATAAASGAPEPNLPYKIWRDDLGMVDSEKARIYDEVKRANAGADTFELAGSAGAVDPALDVLTY